MFVLSQYSKLDKNLEIRDNISLNYYSSITNRLLGTGQRKTTKPTGDWHSFCPGYAWHQHTDIN
jgi:hypothetical protein